MTEQSKGMTAAGEDYEQKTATETTRKVNAAVFAKLPFDNKDDFEDAQRGFIARPESLDIRTDQGESVWNMDRYGFEGLDAQPADTVNPSLWRHARINSLYGLFEVTASVYQVRGYDVSNMTIIEGRNGLIVVDPLISVEVAKAGMDLYFQHRPRKPVAAVIYTHSHLDHFGGVKGVVSDSEVEAGKVQIIAPEGFLDHAISENLMAGTAMGRRAMYMYGTILPAGMTGQVDVGIGKAVSTGTASLIPPTDIITGTGQEMTIEGVRIIFQMTPGTEAPAELNFFLPGLKALCIAEISNHSMHNLVTLRGAQVRDAKAWSRYLNEAIELFAEGSEVLFMGHLWPVWGRDHILNFLKKQRDLYKYIHDQTLRLLNQGYTGIEIAEVLELPESLATEWPCRGFYGTVSHNSKAVYQKYLGWFDGNPANLHALPPVEAGKRYVELMGGADAMIAHARKSFDKGEYRWVAQLVSHLVFADPKNAEARGLLADALEQLGYQAESAVWRNFYLMGAMELRKGVNKTGAVLAPSPDFLKALPMEMVFDYIAILLDGPRAAGKTIVLNWIFTDIGKKYVLNLENCALTCLSDKQAARADATIMLERASLGLLLTRQSDLQKELSAGNIKVEGSTEKIEELFSLLDAPDPWFNIVTP